MATPETVLRASKAGVGLEVELDRVSVEAGGTINAHLALRNDRDVPLEFVEPCAGTPMTVAVAIPATPVGRSWTGIRGAFKDYALEQSQGAPMEWSIREPLPTLADPAPCHAQPTDGPIAGVARIDAGATYETDFAWPAELVRGVPAPAGGAPMTMSVQIDPTSAEGGFVSSDTIGVTETLTVLPAGQPSLSPGEVLDAAIADRRFAAWLARQPRKTWANANLFPMPAAQGVEAVPVVPYWDVELFREPRSFAILLIDPLTGAVLRRNFCNAPCDR